jgi:hypothetical protein
MNILCNFFLCFCQGLTGGRRSANYRERTVKIVGSSPLLVLPGGRGEADRIPRARHRTFQNVQCFE